MGNYEQLKQSVSDVIKTNGNQEITGSILQNVLLTIISTVGANATFAGVATTTTNPGTPDGPVFYLASEGGVYTNFNAIELQDGLSVLMWNGTWSSQQIFGVDDEPTAGSNNLAKSGGVKAEIDNITGIHETENYSKQVTANWQTIINKKYAIKGQGLVIIKAWSEDGAVFQMNGTIKDESGNNYSVYPVLYITNNTTSESTASYLNFNLNNGLSNIEFQSTNKTSNGTVKVKLIFTQDGILDELSDEIDTIKESLSEKGELTPSQENLSGYVDAGNVGDEVSFSSVGEDWANHCVYENLDPNKIYGISCIGTGYGGKIFGFVITDSNNRILQSVTNGEIVPTGFVGENTFYFNNFPSQSKIYASYADSAKCIFCDKSVLLDVSKEIQKAIDTSKTFTKGMLGTLYERLSFGIFEAFGLTYVSGSGTEVQSTSEDMLYFSLDSNGEPSYTTSYFENSFIFEIQRNNTGNNWEYVYISSPYSVVRSTIANNGFINAVMLDSNNKVIAASVIHSKVLRIPKNSKLILCGYGSDCKVYKNCGVVSSTSFPARSFFGTKDFACDGDSLVRWPSYTNTKLGFKTLNNNSMGNAKCCDRTSATSGVTKYPQWAPDCTPENPFIDYKGLSDPNYAGGGESIYESGTPEFDQATANNCLYGHLGRYIMMVNNGTYPEPDIFIMNIAGVNDAWSTGNIDSKIGTFNVAIAGSYNQIQRNTILNSIRWFVTRFRVEYPNCKLFWKTSTQQCAENHTYYYEIEEPLLKLLRFLSVPVIDSYAEVGVMRELEHNPDNNNQWTYDGTHLTDAGYQMDGEFVASKLKSWFSCYF